LCLELVCGNAQDMKYKGYPSREGKIDLRSNFENPPKGYGNVPFYWWDGDTLKYERLVDQLNILSEASVDGLSVSYIHTHPQVDVAFNSNGYGGFGKADAGIPEFYSDEWWNLWNRFSGECAKKNIGLGVDDYVVGWAKNGFYIDKVLQATDIRNYQGRLHLKRYEVGKGENMDIEIPDHMIAAVAYPGGTDLTSYIQNDRLKWISDKEQVAYVVYTTASPELHPKYGERLVDAYFNQFEERLDEQGRKGINYFFQDELHYDLNIHSWCEDMPEQFEKRKGYDIFPYLPALWEDVGSVTPKIRMDYAQVVTELAEERYFKPIFDWHHERGLIYGCDNNGRGLEPLQYMDYFRAISWFTAPGNDAPARGSSFRQTKVSSSITHLYKRPRTWLEAFHSMGWDSNGEWLTSQLDHHLIAGGNLLCLHGLYYSTHGGWWEWAPPCFHFRMPYWQHMKRWLKYAERMSFVLSQGTHACDIAVMYPTEAMHAYSDIDLNLLWQVTDELSERGLDYDYMDYQSLQRAEVKNQMLHVADERYKVLILVDMKAMHYETLLKIYEFYQNGGIVLSVGDLPQATTRIGSEDGQVDTIVHDMFSGEKSGFCIKDAQSVPEYILSLLTPDFKTQSGEGKVLHRKVGNQDVYMVMNVHRGDEVFFRSKGKVESWNAWNGNITEMPILRLTDEGTWIKYNADYNESKLFVFTPGTPVFYKGGEEVHDLLYARPIDGEWNIEIIPTLNNKWGDFRLPASNEFIGPEAREFAYQFVSSKDPVLNMDQHLSYKGFYGYAPYMETLTLPSSVDLSKLLPDSLDDREWFPYCYSWQYGVFDSPGSQGYHGLKGKVDNRFLILDQGGHQIFRTYLYAPRQGEYQMVREGVLPTYAYLDSNPIYQDTVRLDKGWHCLVLAYADTPKCNYILEEKKSYSVDDRKRSAVVFYPVGLSQIKDNYPYDTIVAMKWYKTNHLIYSPFKDKNGFWIYRFQTAPGTYQMTMSLNGSVKSVWVDNRKIESDLLRNQGQNSWVLDMGKYYRTGISTITIMAEPDCGSVGPSFFQDPVKMRCRGGKMLAGNWTEQGALKFYSGGIKYSKEVTLHETPDSTNIVLDLGKVNATCEVFVNGQSIDVLMHSPYQVNIGKFLKQGNNRIEVLVYSTLSNHYQTIPSAYRGNPISGLLGPVRLLFYK